MGPGKDPSGTDQLYTMIHLKVRSIINIQLIPAIGFANPDQAIATLRHMLTQPRKPLYYDLTSLPNETSATPIINLPNGLDDANGPWPDTDAFSAVYTTPTTVEVTWGVLVCLKDCPFSQNNNYLSLRWEDSLSWDNTWKATYQRQGTLIISSLDPLSIDGYRRAGIMTPAVAPGFQRVRAHYLCSRSGLRCDFTFIDEQIRYAPPPGVVEMDITQQENGANLGVMRDGSVVVALVGAQNSNPRDLLMWAQTIALARVRAARNIIAVNGKSMGQLVVKTHETTKGLDVTCMVTYKAAPTPELVKKGGGNRVLGGAAAGAAIGSFIPGVGTLLGGLIGGAAGAFAGGDDDGGGGFVGGIGAAVGAILAGGGLPDFPWVGWKTTPMSPENPQGFGAWADPNGAMNGPVAGVGLATSMGLFAAILRDPCGTNYFNGPGSNGSSGSGGDIIFTTTPLGGGGGSSNSNTRQPAIPLSQGIGDGITSASRAILSGALAGALADNRTTTETNNQSALWFYDGLPGVYDFWQSSNEYMGDPGTLVIPTADPNGVNIQVNHSSAMAMLRKRWAASRIGSYPKVPPKQLADSNWVLVGETTPVRELKLATDGVSVQYEVSGVYDYQALDASKVDRTADIPPFLNPVALAPQSDWFDLQNAAQLSGGSSSNSQALPTLSSGGASSSPLGSGQLLWQVPN